MLKPKGTKTLLRDRILNSTPEGSLSRSCSSSTEFINDCGMQISQLKWQRQKRLHPLPETLPATEILVEMYLGAGA